MSINGRIVGPGHPCYVIAELGVNHNGSLSLARDLVKAAKQAGADCAKFQTFRASNVATASAPKAGYQKRTTGERESQLEMLRRLELPTPALVELVQLCREQRIEFLSTPYSEEDAEVLAGLGAAAFKVPSALIVEPAYLRTLARFGKPLILSTGMATLAEVNEAVSLVREAGNTELVLLQCTTEYPADIQDANLRVMGTLAAAFSVPVGFSDHTRSSTASIAAVTLGAAVIEKHLTIDQSLEGPDHSASANPAEFSDLVSAIREAELALGRAEKEPAPGERQNLVMMRRSVVARAPIRTGTLLEAGMLTMKRPATGIAPKELPRVVGSRARVEIPADAPLEWWMLERPDDL